DEGERAPSGDDEVELALPAAPVAGDDLPAARGVPGRGPLLGRGPQGEAAGGEGTARRMIGHAGIVAAPCDSPRGGAVPARQRRGGGWTVRARIPSVAR